MPTEETSVEQWPLSEIIGVRVQLVQVADLRSKASRPDLQPVR